MLKSTRSVILLALCCVAGVASFSVAVSQGASSRGGGGSGAPAIDGPLSEAMLLPNLSWLIGEEQWHNRERAMLTNPQAISARQMSRTAYEHLSASAAAHVAQEAFPETIERVAGGPPQLPAGQRVARYLNDKIAQLALPNGKHAVIESSQPFAIQTGRKSWSPVDLNLVRAGQGFSPTRSAVAVAIPNRLSSGVRLGATGVSLTPVSSSGAALSGSPGMLDGSLVMYANTQLDSDTTVKPTQAGFETITLLRSVKSPERLSFKVGMPAGARLVFPKSTKGGAFVALGHRVLAAIPTPTAQDTAGTAVPISLKVSGDALNLTIKHSSHSYRYPIAVDPTLVDNQLLKTETPHLALPNWEGSTNKPSAWEVESNFSWMVDYTKTSVINEDEAQMHYRSQGESQIYKFVSTTEIFTTNWNNVISALSIGKVGAGGTEFTLELPYKYTSTAHTLCINSCNPPSSPKENRAVFVQKVIKTGEEYLEASMTSAEVFITQEKGPALSWDTTDPTIAGAKNALYGSGWGNGSSIVELKASDPGLGVSKFWLKWPGHSEAEWGVKRVYIHPEATEAGRCFGDQCEPCVGIQCEIGAKHTDDSLALLKLAEGEDTVEAKVEDPASLTATSTHVVKYDNAAPHDLAITGLPSSHEIGEGQYHLKLKGVASDGSGTTLSSGIASLALTIDGQPVGSSTTSCTPGPCTASHEWSVNAESYGVGEHTLTLTATDAASNVTKEEVTITLRHAESVSVGPGELNPVTGEYNLGATDVNIPAGQSSLSVGRDYSSLHTGNGSDGPFGAPWTMNVGPEQTITKSANGNVVLVGTDGKLTTFIFLGGGKFAAPAGDTNLSLSEKTVSGKVQYVLSNQGSSTTFAIPKSGDGTVWKPSVVEGTLGVSSASTYAFQTVSGVTEPTKELAPVPAGVTCSIETPPSELKRGCRELTFTYGVETISFGEKPNEWGDVKGRLKEVSLVAWDPAKGEMTTTAVAKYLYDNRGKLRAEWDPRVSPALKTIYGYDPGGHVSAIQDPGSQPALFSYGLNEGDASAGRLMSISRPGASTTLGEGTKPANTAVPTLSTSSPTLAKSLSVTTGTWSNAPLSYSYQWERCQSGGANCVPIYGARNPGYTPRVADDGYTLVGQVTAINAGGSETASSTASSAVAATTPVYSMSFGSAGTENGQFKLPMNVATDSSGNVWVSDYSNNRIQEFSSKGVYLHAYGTTGAENGQFKGPWGVAIEQSTGNVFVSDTGNCRIQELKANGEFIRKFGSCGTGVGQLSSTPAGIKLDPEGNLWVADSTNNRLEVFTSTGAYMRTVGSEGSGEGQLKAPRDIAFAGGNVYVADMSNNRIEEFSLEGAYVAQFGTSGSGNGQLSLPIGIAVDPTTSDLFVADAGNNRIQEFNQAGVYLTKFGTLGSGEGQMSAPSGITVTPSGEIYVVDKSNNRVQLWVPKPAASYASQFGAVGTGNGQFKGAAGVAVDNHGDVWATDAYNNRVEEFSPGGTYMFSVGSYGSGEHFSFPTGIAIDKTTGNIFIADEGNGLVVELGPNGEFKRGIGSEGTTNGKFKYPNALAIDGSGNLWVADGGNNRVQELNANGEFLQAIGTLGTGNGQFKFPAGVAFSGGYLYVVDGGNSRVQWFTTGGTYEGQFGTAGSGNGQFSSPAGIATEPTTGELVVADTSNFRLQVFSLRGTFLETIGSSGSGNGQFSKPMGLTFTPSGGMYIADFNNNRVQKFVTAYTGAEAPAPPTTGTTAVTTVAYNVPVSGAGAPYAMGSSEVSAWAQTDVPAEATAVFPPDEPQGTPVADYKNATIYYLDGVDRLVNVASPGGAISTTEYNAQNSAVRSLTAANRESALKEGAKSAEVAQTLDMQSTYGSEGSELLSTLGPLHKVKLASGAEVQARRHAQYYYDEGAPSEEAYRLVTKVTTGAQISGEPEADIRTTVTSYSGQNNLGWLLRKPTSTTIDPSGLKLVHTTVYDPTTGAVTETRTPGAGAASEENTGSYVTAYGKLGSGNVEYSKPGAIAVDKFNNIWVADTENNRVEEISSAGAFVRAFGTVGETNGKFKKPEGIAIDAAGRVWVADTGNNRVQEFSSTGGFLGTFGSAGSTLGKFSGPTGIAVSGGEGFIYVADRGNNRIEAFLGGEGTYTPFFSFGSNGSGNGQLKAPEGLVLDASGNIWVADSGNNRVEEFSVTGFEGVYVRKFGASGSGNGQLSAPEGLTIDSESNVWVADGGNGRVQAFSTSGVYEAQFGVKGSGEHQFLAPAGVVVGASKDIDVLDTGNSRVQVWVPPVTTHEAKGSGGTHGVQTIYYTAAANAKYPGCGEHAEWAMLPCQSQPAAQPETSGIPNLPVTTVTYNMWQESLVSTETVGTTTRTTTATYDSGGRALTSEITSTVGTALPVVKDEYDSKTGALVKVNATIEGKTRTVASAFNSLGELTSYTDADENTSTFNYDLDGRLEKANDGKGTQTFSYDPTTGAATSMTDSAAGTFTASYDGAGQLLSAGYPNGMSANYTYNADEETTKLEYVKTTHCSSACTWYSDSVTPSISGQWLGQTSSLSSQSYTYDAMGRLTKVQDTPSGQGCTTRIYAYDEETDRTGLTTRSPGGGGACATEGGTTETHGYDTADRLTDTSISYDTFGRITKLPASDAGGSEVTSSYYVGDELASQTQKGETIGYSLDPIGRTREIISTGNVNSTVTQHFASPSDSPAWTVETTGKWTRNVAGLAGGLVAVQKEGEVVLQVENLHGDVIATASTNELATSLLSTNDTSEYGVPRTSTPPKYSWLGGASRSTELPSGIIAMGARSYVPQIGRFLQTDPVEGGSANAYAYTFGDPVNTSDPSGEHTWQGEVNEESAYGAQVGAEIAAAAAARQAAARAEALTKAASGTKVKYGPHPPRVADGGPTLAQIAGGVGRGGHVLCGKKVHKKCYDNDRDWFRGFLREANDWIWVHVNPFNPGSTVTVWVGNNAQGLGDVIGCSLTFWANGYGETSADICKFVINLNDARDGGLDPTNIDP